MAFSVHNWHICKIVNLRQYFRNLFKHSYVQSDVHMTNIRTSQTSVTAQQYEPLLCVQNDISLFVLYKVSDTPCSTGTVHSFESLCLNHQYAKHIHGCNLLQLVGRQLVIGRRRRRRNIMLTKILQIDFINVSMDCSKSYFPVCQYQIWFLLIIL